MPRSEVYVELVTKAAEALIAAGDLLPADLDEIVPRVIWCYNLGCVPPSTHGALNKVSRLMMLMVVGASRDIMPKAAF